MKKLSDRALELLQLIDDCTKWEGTDRPGGKVMQYFVPSRHPRHCETLNKVIDVHGPGDANILKMLSRRRLTKGQLFEYSYSITEEGIAVLADQWQRIKELTHVDQVDPPG